MSKHRPPVESIPDLSAWDDGTSHEQGRARRGAAMSKKPMEALPEHVHQGIPTNRITAAIASLQHAENASTIKDKLEYLRRANESIMYARRSAESVAASWREYNERAREIGAFIHEDELITLDSEVLF